jgi:hypothetical protein
MRGARQSLHDTGGAGARAGAGAGGVTGAGAVKEGRTSKASIDATAAALNAAEPE